MPIEHISDTARWVAVYRAMESARPDALFNDPFAARLAGAKGAEIVDSIPRGRQMAWSMIVRTAVFDEIIMEKVRGGGVDTVLNLAAGLDARAWRLPLPSALRWIDVDLPGILDYKTEHLKDQAPQCRYEAVAADLTDESRRLALFGQVGRESQRVLIVSEGLLVYLTEDAVARLAAALHEPASFRWWLFDIASPRLLEWMTHRWGGSVAHGNAPFQFAPAAGTRFFEPFGWHEVEFRSTTEEAHRLRREMRMMWFWRFLGRLASRERREQFRRFSGYALLERT